MVAKVTRPSWSIGWLGWLSLAVSRQVEEGYPTVLHSIILCLPWLCFRLTFRSRWEGRTSLAVTFFQRRELTLVNGWRPLRWEGGERHWYFLPVWKSAAPRDIVWAEGE